MNVFYFQTSLPVVGEEESVNTEEGDVVDDSTDGARAIEEGE